LERRAISERIREAAEANDLQTIVEIVAGEHAADVADLLETLDEDVRVHVLRALPDAMAGDVLDEIDNDVMADLLEELRPEQSADIVEAMSSDDAAELLGEIHEDVAAEIIGHMEPDEAAEVRELLAHEEDTAGRIMATEVFALEESFRTDEAISYVRAVADDVETIYYVYVVDHEGRLTGVLSLRELLLAPMHTRLADVMRRELVTVTPDMDQEEAARLVAKFDLLAVPIVDAERRLVGMVTVDDAVDVLESEAAEDMLALAGTSEESDVRRSPMRSALARLPWLLVCVVGELMSGGVIRGFDRHIQDLARLAVFVPVVMATGGNVGTQSLATTIRAIATNEFGSLRAWQVIMREFGVGCLVGMLCGALAGLAAIVWLQDVRLALVLCLSMMLSQSVSSGMGAATPLFFRAIGRDPALASGPFITTLNDIGGLALYFGLAVWLMGA
jgi:magnesium transporter